MHPLMLKITSQDKLVRGSHVIEPGHLPWPAPSFQFGRATLIENGLHHPLGMGASPPPVLYAEASTFDDRLYRQGYNAEKLDNLRLLEQL